VEVKVYVCPTEGCTNYYGASNMGDLSLQYTGVKREDKHLLPAEDSRVGVEGMRHNRAECPDCRQRGVFVERELRTIRLPARATA
jgi:hypothetical protein